MRRRCRRENDVFSTAFLNQLAQLKRLSDKQLTTEDDEYSRFQELKKSVIEKLKPFLPLLFGCGLFKTEIDQEDFLEDLDEEFISYDVKFHGVAGDIELKLQKE